VDCSEVKSRSDERCPGVLCGDMKSRHALV